jgi:hypothetical protein
MKEQQLTGLEGGGLMTDDVLKRVAELTTSRGSALVDRVNSATTVCTCWHGCRNWAP